MPLTDAKLDAIHNARNQAFEQRIADKEANGNKRQGRSYRQLVRAMTDEVTWAIERYAGNLTEVSKFLDVPYFRLTEFVDGDTELMGLVLSYRKSLVDMAEDNLRRDLEAGDQKATLFALKTLGADRGYVTQTESVNTTTVNHNTTTMDMGKLSMSELREIRRLSGKATGESPGDGAKVVEHVVDGQED